MTQHSKLNSLKTKILKDTPTFHSPRTPDELSYAPNDMSAQNPHTHQVFIPHIKSKTELNKTNPINTHTHIKKKKPQIELTSILY